MSVKRDDDDDEDIDVPLDLIVAVEPTIELKIRFKLCI